MEPKKVVIIGGGMSGLIAGIYLRMNGFAAEIYESNDKPGGLCTTWERNGYSIDGCIHWLAGSSPNDNFHLLWKELIDIGKVRFAESNVFLRVEDNNGKFINIYTDVNKLRRELLLKAPEDKALILEMCRVVEKISNLNMPNEKAPELYNILDSTRFAFKMMPYISIFRKYINMSASGFASRFRNELLRKTIEHLFLPEMAVIFLFFTLAWLNKKSAGYPLGGSLQFARLFEERYKQLGGIILYGHRVRQILTGNKDGRSVVTGVALENGDVVNADIVVSAADAHHTLFNILGEPFVDKKIKKVFRDFKPFPSLLQVSLGIDRRVECAVTSMVIPLHEPVTIDPQTEISDIHIRIHSFDPTLAPNGKTLITVHIHTRGFQYWSELRHTDFTRYQAEKKQILDAVVETIKNRFGLLDKDIVMNDVTTPATLIRYTGNWQGSFEGWLMTPETGFRKVPKTLKGLDNFYLCGHWVQPGGGLPSCLLSGRNVTQIICRNEKVKFTVIPPE